MQEDARAENEARAEAGYEPVHVIGWAAPHYDEPTHKLYWAKELAFGDEPDHTLNYNVRVLGRRGVLVLNAVAAMDQLATVETDMTRALAAVEFNYGHRYADYTPGTDKLAAYGIGALIAGNVAAKAGLFKVLLGALLAAKKAIVLGVMAVVVVLKRVFSRRKVVGERAN